MLGRHAALPERESPGPKRPPRDYRLKQPNGGRHATAEALALFLRVLACVRYGRILYADGHGGVDGTRFVCDKSERVIDGSLQHDDGKQQMPASTQLAQAFSICALAYCSGTGIRACRSSTHNQIVPLWHNDICCNFLRAPISIKSLKQVLDV